MDPDANRLLIDLLSNYSKDIRPVVNSNEIITLKLGLKLSQIADIDEKNQIMTTNVWIKQEWVNKKLNWIPAKYGNIKKINIPSSQLWIADVVLYNNAEGDYHITSKTTVTVFYDGRIVWEPPMIYKSYCAIDIEYYPFDIQSCYMKFGCWSYDGSLIDLEHIDQNNSTKQLDQQLEETFSKLPHDGTITRVYTIEDGIDMTEYYESVEWDILSVPAQKNIKYYECCPDPYYDIYFNITIRRKTLFYTVNLIIPCVNISFLCV
jgi:nicotinic acetylcholine receptor, invertebrate